MDGLSQSFRLDGRVALVTDRAGAICRSPCNDVAEADAIGIRLFRIARLCLDDMPENGIGARRIRPAGAQSDLLTANAMQGSTVYLASDTSSHVTGHNLIVDGGYTAW